MVTGTNDLANRDCWGAWGLQPIIISTVTKSSFYFQPLVFLFSSRWVPGLRDWLSCSRLPTRTARPASLEFSRHLFTLPVDQTAKTLTISDSTFGLLLRSIIPVMGGSPFHRLSSGGEMSTRVADVWTEFGFRRFPPELGQWAFVHLGRHLEKLW